MEGYDFHDKPDDEPEEDNKYEPFLIGVFSTLLVELIYWGLLIFLNHGRM